MKLFEVKKEKMGSMRLLLGKFNSNCFTHSVSNFS
uniref:Uncharacterized protein n=1 Tax=Ligilactobacillus acidipiscis TaxID=89059 RepID=A0A2R8FGD2_9LACO|nr:hypothetical protein PLAC02_P52 [Ligilactobacillus acidipiscis]